MSARFAVAAAETVAAAALRRAALGEPAPVARPVDLSTVVDVLRGKLEFASGEEGREQRSNTSCGGPPPTPPAAAGGIDLTPLGGGDRERLSRDHRRARVGTRGAGRGTRSARNRPDPEKARGAHRCGNPLFDPQEDGIDFYESLEGMLTEVRNAVAVGPTSELRHPPTGNRDLPCSPTAAPARASGPTAARSSSAASTRARRRSSAAATSTPSGSPSTTPTTRTARSCRSPTCATASPRRSGGRRLHLRQLQVPRAQQPAARRRQAQAGDHAQEAARRVRRRLLQRREPRRARPDRPATTAWPTRSSTTCGPGHPQPRGDPGQRRRREPGADAADVTTARLIEAIVAAGGPRYDYRQVDPAPPTAATTVVSRTATSASSFLFRTDVRDLASSIAPAATPTTPTSPSPAPAARRS